MYRFDAVSATIYTDFHACRKTQAARENLRRSETRLSREKSTARHIGTLKQSSHNTWGVILVNIIVKRANIAGEHNGTQP